MTMNTTETISAMTRTAKKYHRAGVDALGRNRPEDAVRALRLAVELDPKLVVAWNDLGVVMEALGNAHEAVRCYKRALALRPGSVEARSNLGMLMLQMELAQVLRRQALTSRAAVG
jgi:Flp pilus assembly protein TadD